MVNGAPSAIEVYCGIMGYTDAKVLGDISQVSKVADILFYLPQWRYYQNGTCFFTTKTHNSY